MASTGRRTATGLALLPAALAVVLSVVLVAVLTAVLTGTLTSPAASGAVPAGSTSERPFSPSSAFNTPIGDQVSLDPRSAAMVRVLAGRGYATAQVYADTPPVYDAQSGTPRYQVDCTMPWGTCDLERQRVPIPAGAVPSPGYDGNMVVVDWSTRKVFEFWQYDGARGDQAGTSWGAVCSLDGSGTGTGTTSPCRAGAVGAGVSRLAGVVRTHEIRSGRITHALVGYTGNSCTSHRYPAVKSDGWSSAGDCIPEGARVQLDPRVRCAALTAPGWEKLVCRALKRYGWYNIDNGGPRGRPGFGVQFENPHGEADPYPAVGLYDYHPIKNIPLTRLRVLRAWDSSR